MQVLSFFRKAGKEQSFEALISPYLELLFKVAYQYLGNKPDAEDLLQDLLVDLYANQQKVKKVEKLKPWLMRCLYNKFIDNHRKNKAMQFSEDVEDPKLAMMFAYQPRLEEQRLHQQILRGLDALSAKQRAVVCLHDIDGFTLPELANIIEVPVGTLKSDLHRAREKIKKQLNLQPSDIATRYCEQG